jgi:hypothetical protein
MQLHYKPEFVSLLHGAVVAIALLPACACGGGASVHAQGATSRTRAFTVLGVDENLVGVVVDVDQNNPSASDNNPGTAALPFRTIAAALQSADQLVHRGIGAKVEIHAGVYREALALSPAAASVVAPLVIEGDGNPIVSGADPWTGWQRQGSAGMWTHAWPYQWGNAPYPPGWEGNVVLEPIVTRREMVIVNGWSLTQVLSPRNLTAGTFLVSESAETITVMVSPAADLNSATVQVAVRSPLLQVQGRTNVVVRGITFQYANTPLPNGAVLINNSAKVLVQNCTFVWNNWDGMDVTTSQDVNISNVHANNNGGSGMSGYQILRLLVDSSQTSANNWRGAMGGFTGWDVAGSKFELIHNGLFRGYTSLNNQARGLWLDTDDVNVAIESSRFENNLRDGIFFEANQGPLLLTGSRMCGASSGAGVAGSVSANVLLTRNVICGNSQGQLLITGDTDRNVTNWETGEVMDVRAENWTVCGDTLQAVNSNQPSLSTPDWPWFLESLASDWNVWVIPKGASSFVVGSQNLSFTGWRASTGEDRHSLSTIAGAAFPSDLADRLPKNCAAVR